MTASALVGVSRANAGTAETGPNAFSYVAAAGETNHVVIAKDPIGVRVLDTGAPVIAGDACTPVTANEVVCESSPSPNLVVLLGDRNDFVLIAGAYVRVRVSGQSGSDTLNGSDFDDLLIGGSGADTLRGGVGNDRLRGGLGDDVLVGSFGQDVADYSERTGPVRADLDRVADDGVVGEADRLVDIQGLAGGTADDVLVGSTRPDLILGGAGDDVLRGGGWHDLLIGGPGKDRIWGERGSDRLRGGDGSDTLVGGAFRDRFWGDAGRDVLVARDGSADRVVDGGPGHDAARIDRGRDHPRNVERLL